MPTQEQFTLEFCDRWIDKANAYTGSQLNEAFDKYFTLYVCFNRLYDQIGESAHRKETEDSKLSTSVFAEVVGRENIWAILGTAEGHWDLRRLSELVGPGGAFNIHFDRRTGRPAPIKDAKLKQGLISAEPDERVDSVLTLLYQVRCNLVHGRKAMNEEQLELLKPCTESLRRVIVAGRRWLADYSQLA